MQDKFLAIDQGTSATKAVLFGQNGAVLGSGKKEYGVQNRGGGYVEQDPEELFAAAVQSAVTAMGNCTPKEIAAIGISVQTGAFLLWNRISGMPMTPVISWQCKRGRSFLDSLLPEEKIRFRKIVSNQLEDDGVPAKLAQVFVENPMLYTVAEENNLLFGTMESWLIWRLTGGEIHKSDITNACITRLYLEKENRWNLEALEILGIPSNIFPEVVDNSTYMGTVRTPGLAGIEIHSAMGDSAAAMFGECCWERGQSKITYGTGVSYLVHLNDGKERFYLPDVFLGWRMSGSCHYVWEGTLSHAGSLVEWLKQLGIITAPAETESLAKALDDNGGVYFFPETVFGGMEQNIFWGTDFRTKKSHLARAVLESIAFRIRDMQKALERAGLETKGEIHADGGMATNDFLMQFQADILGQDIIYNRHRNMSAYGAFLMAAFSKGFLSLEEIRALKHENRCYHPMMSDKKRDEYLQEWERAKERLNKTIFPEDL